jgi:hypothetical protein
MSLCCCCFPCCARATQRPGVSRPPGHTCTHCVCAVRCVRHEVAVARSPSASPAQSAGYDEAPTRSPAVKNDVQLPQLGGSDRFVNRQSVRQTHDKSGAKQLAWPVDPNRRDEPTLAPRCAWRSAGVIEWRFSPTGNLHYHTTTRAWRVDARDFVSERLRRTADDSASISRQSPASDWPNTDRHD